jgi:hypothetical protein
MPAASVLDEPPSLLQDARHVDAAVFADEQPSAIWRLSVP